MSRACGGNAPRSRQLARPGKAPPRRELARLTAHPTADRGFSRQPTVPSLVSSRCLKILAILTILATHRGKGQVSGKTMFFGTFVLGNAFNRGVSGRKSVYPTLREQARPLAVVSGAISAQKRTKHQHFLENNIRRNPGQFQTTSEIQTNIFFRKPANKKLGAVTDLSAPVGLFWF